METFLPAILVTGLMHFRQGFSSIKFRYFCGFVVGLLIATGGKTSTRLSEFCFWVNRSSSSWERLLSTMVWDSQALTESLIELIEGWS